MPCICLLGTMDTKGPEFGYVKACIERAGVDTLLVDAGVLADPVLVPDIPREDVARAAGTSIEELRRDGDRGRSVEAMTRGVAHVAAQLGEEGRIDGILSLGGSAGTTIGTSAMRSLPVGFPKLMVSTMASGDTSPYVGTRDITMMYSVVDIAGINRLSAEILANAAHAMVGMVTHAPAELSSDRTLVGATMFGVTTPCVTRIRERLDASGFELLIFHATGSGGRAMEDLVRDGFIKGVLDVTTTELADELVGGVLTAGPDRLEAMGEAGIPHVVVPGALDMVNFGPRDSVPAKFDGRTFYQHNPTVTLMRTTETENAQLGRLMAAKLNRATGSTVVVVPLRGYSALDIEGGAFADADADRAWLEALKEDLAETVDLVELDLHINDDTFADRVVEAFLERMARTRQLP